MSSRSFASFDPAPHRTDDPPTRNALLAAFLSSLPGAGEASEVQYRAAVRHFLGWLGHRSIPLRSIDDGVVQRFEQHRCGCPGYSAHGPYKADAAGRVRRFVRFLEDRGFVDLTGEVDELGQHLAVFAATLEALQYSTVAARSYRSEADHFAAWMRVSRLPWADVDAERIDQYAHHHCRCPVFRKRGELVGSGTKRRRRGALRFVEFLRDRGVIAPVAPATDVDPRISAYIAWLKQHRGAAETTITRYRAELIRLRPLLGEPLQWDAATIRRAFERRSKQTPGSVSLLVSIIRSYIRFAIGQGECPPALLHAIPPVRRYRPSTLPRYVDAATIETIIAACGSSRPVEVRDKAIILLLARLGLRAGDVRDLRLDDIDWRAGYLKVSGKGRRSDRLPLPQDVGDAILAYLASARPRVAEQHLFLRSLAPFTPFRSASEIAGIVARVLDRGGFEGLPTGSHVFRHSLATNMLRAGASLESVGTMLRHRTPDTTAIYAKVDLPMLTEIAQPWPGELPC